VLPLEALLGRECTLGVVQSPKGRLRLEVSVLLGVSVRGKEGLQRELCKKE